MKTLFKVLAISSLFFISSCGLEEFGVKKNKQTNTTENYVTSTNSGCADSTLVKPPVDFLFVWDNSGSQFSVSEGTKRALNNTISLISDRFDYQILLAPLISYSGSRQYFISSEPKSPSSTTSEPIIVSSRDAASSNLASFAITGNGSEAGMQRIINLIKNNVSNGVFRSNAYTMIVIMSNEDDDSWAGQTDPPPVHLMQPFIDERFQDLMCLRGNYSGNTTSRCSGFPNLNSLMMRFFSMVPHSNNCIGGYRRSYVYKGVSEKVYLASYNNGLSNPTGASSPYDSVNICNGMNDHIFDGINNSIQDKVIGHKYRYWPVTSNTSARFSEDSIVVKKNTGEEFFATNNSNGTGFKYRGVQTVNTRIEPTEGEPFTGHVIELFGDAQVQYPECLIVSTTTPTDYYGFIHLDSKPFEDSITVKINGQNIPKSSTNGWQLVKEGSQPKHITNKNIKISSPTDYTPANPAVLKTGYFLQVFGSAVYSNGAVVEVIYDPSS